MIEHYKQYLKVKMQEAGLIPKYIYTDMKHLKSSSAVRLGGVLFEKESFEKDGSKRIYTNQDGKKVKRIRKFKRITTLIVVIGEESDQNCEALFSSFLANLDDGIDDGKGNNVEIEVGEADWVEEKDSILKSHIAVQVPIQFAGGIYKDVSLVPITDVHVEGEIKEGAYGS